MEIKVPDLGVDSAEVSEIMVKVGDVINVDDNIVLLESDKASVEVPATSAGTITAISIQIGDKVKEGDVILTIDSAGNTQSDIAPVEQSAKQTDQQVAQSTNNKGCSAVISSPTLTIHSLICADSTPRSGKPKVCLPAGVDD